VKLVKKDVANINKIFTFGTKNKTIEINKHITIKGFNQIKIVVCNKIIVVYIWFIFNNIKTNVETNSN